jgi:hypothetical protein
MSILICGYDHTPGRGDPLVEVAGVLGYQVRRSLTSRWRGRLL